MKTTPNPASRAVTGKLILFSALGAYFAVLFAGGLINGGKTSVIDPDFIAYLHPLYYALAWLAVAAGLVLYGSVSKALVYRFTWLSAFAYALWVSVSGGSTYLAVAACGLVSLMTAVCARALEEEGVSTAKRGRKPPFVLSPLGGRLAAAALAALAGGGTLFLLLSSYLCYVTSPSVSTGVYIQMMESLRSGFSFDTTLEFGEAVSHLAAHISPIFFVYLPFYALIPSPVTLMVLQVLAVYSAVIPLWKICRGKGLSPALSALVCGLLCLYPAVWGGTAGALHEYALLLPLLLWLLWSFEARKGVLPWVLSALVLCVRETCAVHLFAVALYRLVTVSKKTDGEELSLRRERFRALLLMGISAVWLITCLTVLTHAGKGTLITRFQNVTGEYGSFFDSLIREFVYNPALIFYEMLSEDKLKYLLTLLLPLGLLPVLSKRKAGLVFLIPTVLLNLVSDFPFHFSLDYPYSFAVAAFALYLTADTLAHLVSSADKARLTKRLTVLAVCFTLIVGGFRLAGYGLFTEYAFDGRDEVASMTELLEAVEDGAPVSASGRLVPSLAAREEVYYLHQGQLTEYVVIDLREEWATEADAKFDEKYYTDKGYTVVKRCADVGVVLKKGN